MGRKSGILLIVAGTLLLALPPAVFAGFYLALSHSEFQDSFRVSYSFSAGNIARTTIWLLLGFGSLICGIRTVIKAP